MGKKGDRPVVSSRGARGSLPVEVEVATTASDSLSAPSRSGSHSGGDGKSRHRRRHHHSRANSELAEAASELSHEETAGESAAGETGSEQGDNSMLSPHLVKSAGSVRERSSTTRTSHSRNARSHGAASGGRRQSRPALPRLGDDGGDAANADADDSSVTSGKSFPSPKSDGPEDRRKHRVRHKSRIEHLSQSSSRGPVKAQHRRRHRRRERQQTLRKSLQDESKAASWEKEFAALIAAREQGSTAGAVSPVELNLEESTVDAVSAVEHLEESHTDAADVDAELDPLEDIARREAELEAREAMLMAKMAEVRERKHSGASAASSGSSGKADPPAVPPRVPPRTNSVSAGSHSSEDNEEIRHSKSASSVLEGSASKTKDRERSDANAKLTISESQAKEPPTLPQDSKSSKKTKKQSKEKKPKKEKSKMGTFFRHQRRDSQVVRSAARSAADLSAKEIQQFKREQIEKYEAQLREAAASSTNRFLDVADRLNEEESSSDSDVSESELGTPGLRRRNSFSAFDLTTRRELKAYKAFRRSNLQAVDAASSVDGAVSSAANSDARALVEVPRLRAAKSVRDSIIDKLRQSRPTSSYGTLPRSGRSAAEQARVLAQLTFDLPISAIKCVFSFLLLPDILRAERVCTSWHDAASDPALWRNLLTYYDKSLYIEALAAGKVKGTQLDMLIWDDPEVQKFDERQMQRNTESPASEEHTSTTAIASDKEKLSVNQLVARLTQSVGVSDKTDWGAFFISYKSFTTPFQLCRKLIQRFAVPIPSELNGRPADDRELIEFTKSRVNPVQLRVCMAFKRLLDNHFSDLDASCLVLVRAFIRFVMLTSPALGASVRKAFIAGVSSKQRKSSAGTSVERRPGTASKDILKELGVKKIELKTLLDVFKGNLQLVAEQLTLVEFGYLCRMKPVELVSQAYQKGDGDGGTQAMIDHFNDISRWVAKTILDEEKPRQRALRMQQFIEISDHLRKLRNYETLMAIISSLYDPAISRLKVSRSLLRPRSARLMEELHTLMSADQSYAAYREAIAGLPTPMIPYLGVYMRDMIYYEDESQNKAPKGQEVAFWKKKLVFRIMESIEACQSKPYKLDLNPAMQAVLKDLPVPECGNEEYRNVLFDLSLMREPRTMRKQRL